MKLFFQELFKRERQIDVFCCCLGLAGDRHGRPPLPQHGLHLLPRPNQKGMLPVASAVPRAKRLKEIQMEIEGNSDEFG